MSISSTYTRNRGRFNAMGFKTAYVCPKKTKEERRQIIGNLKKKRLTGKQT
jgi:hypothetical protein